MRPFELAFYAISATLSAAFFFGQPHLPTVVFLVCLSYIGSHAISFLQQAGIKSPSAFLVFLCILSFFLAFVVAAASLREAFYLLPLPISVCISAASRALNR
ncbi:MAG: hypothetical protein N3G80_01130 [Candidatus Micrarchaeota archaeon]|nr:hypothetical protein [Candidatus Micrarchaeota archaeon]